MTSNSKKKSQKSALPQILITFIIPIIILTKYSGESQLGPTKALLLALAFPIVYEIYSIRSRKKLSILSLVAIGGIIVTGAISLLGLSEEWLALRRAVPYFVVSVAVLVSIWIKRPLLNMLLPHILDMEKVAGAAKQQRTETQLKKTILNAGYMVAGLFFVITVVTYILTHVVIVSPTDTAGFNEEYARLRLVSLIAITVPMIIGIGGIIAYLVIRIEKLTCLKSEELTKKK